MFHLLKWMKKVKDRWQYLKIWFPNLPCWLRDLVSPRILVAELAAILSCVAMGHVADALGSTRMSDAVVRDQIQECCLVICIKAS